MDFALAVVCPYCSISSFLFSASSPTYKLAEFSYLKKENKTLKELGFSPALLVLLLQSPLWFLSHFLASLRSVTTVFESFDFLSPSCNYKYHLYHWWLPNLYLQLLNEIWISTYLASLLGYLMGISQLNYSKPKFWSLIPNLFLPLFLYLHKW